MLLAAADADITGTPPTGVGEIVDLCGRLPLALGIGGRLAASLGLVGSHGGPWYKPTVLLHNLPTVYTLGAPRLSAAERWRCNPDSVRLSSSHVV